MEAYSNVEAQVPDLVLSCASMRADPAYAMFAAMMQILGVADLPLESLMAAGSADPRAIGALAEQVPRPGAVPQHDRPPLLRGPALRWPLPSGAWPAATLAAGAGGGPGAMQAPFGMSPNAGNRPFRPGAVIVIGASTGGVEALHRVLTQFPADCPPTLVVQHIRGDFAGSFAARLNRACLAEVVVARHLAPLQSGQILIAPGAETHLQIGPAGEPGGALRCRLVGGDKVSGHCPSVDALFRSAVRVGPQAIGVLLTGMGQDGARGLLALRQNGAETIAQDRASSIVYGMPRIAAEIGAAGRILALDRIAEAVLDAARQPVPSGSGTASSTPGQGPLA